MTQTRRPRGFRPRAAQDRAPPIEVFVRSPISFFQFLWPQAFGTEDAMASVVNVPIAVQEPAVVGHALVQRSARIRRENVEWRGLDSLGDRPIDGPVEDLRVVLVHAGEEACV